NLKARVKLLEDREGGATVLSSGVAEVPTGSDFVGASHIRIETMEEGTKIVATVDDQDRANIAKTSTLPSDSTPRVTSFLLMRAELEINMLKAKIKLLEDKDRGVAEQSGDDTPIKGKRLDEGEEAAERVSDDTEEMATVLTSMDASSILTSGGVQVVPTATKVATATVSIPTGSGVVSTASPTIPTAAPIFTTTTESTPYTKRKGKETMVESETPKKNKVQEQIDVQLARELEEEMIRDTQRMNEQIAQDAEIARIHAEEELQMLIDELDRNNETVAKYLQKYHQFAAGWKAKHFKGMTLEEIKERFYPVWKQIQDFIPIGSKEEAERFRRKGLRLEQESVKKLKISKEVKATEEVPREKVKEMMQLVSTNNQEDATQGGGPTETMMKFRLAKALELNTSTTRFNERAFPLPVMEVPLPEEVPTASEESSHCQKKRDATAVKNCTSAEVKQ
nr:amidoxime reducing component [Tanacetum cinerariifolium]